VTGCQSINQFSAICVMPGSLLLDLTHPRRESLLSMGDRENAPPRDKKTLAVAGGGSVRGVRLQAGRLPAVREQSRR
jgi:hypothetical protein